MNIADWGFSRGPGGELEIGGVSAVAMARRYGTPVHVIDEELLRRQARRLREEFEAAYPRVNLYYAVKANSVAGVVRAVLSEGYGAEVMNEYELWLVHQLGLPPARVLLNGPNKGERLMRNAIEQGVGALIVDSLPELVRLERVAGELRKPARLLLRVNPDFTPQGMNQGTQTASRAGSVFGLDLEGGELPEAFDLLRQSRYLEYEGLQTHLGTGLRDPEDYRRGFRKIERAFLEARLAGFETCFFDFGGGFGVSTSKEFSTQEFLEYQGEGRLPELGPMPPGLAQAVCQPLREFCAREGIPEPTLGLEPGRSVVSSAQVLLVTVGMVKERRGLAPWVITDGGAGTCAFPLYYEYHEVLLANDLAREPQGEVSMVGPVCFSSNWIYRRKKMPALFPGDVLAIMDSGAYFLALEGGFDFARTPVVMVSKGRPRVIRRRETLEDMASRDLWEDPHD